MNMDDNNYVDFEEAKPEKNNRTTIIIVSVVAVLLCCCCATLLLGWNYGDQILNAVGF